MLKLCLFTIFLWIVLHSRTSQCHPRVELNRVKYIYDQSLINGSAWLSGKNRLNMMFTYKEDLPEIWLIFKINLNYGPRKFYTVLNVSTNYCERAQAVGSNRIWKIIHEQFFSVSNFPKTCPIPKDDYYVRNFTFPDNMLPGYLPAVDFLSELKFMRRKYYDTQEVFSTLLVFGKVF